MNKASSIAEYLDDTLINRYVYGHLSRQERLQIIDSIKSCLPSDFKKIENKNLQYFLELSDEKIEMQDGFSDINLQSVNDLINDELSFEKLIKKNDNLDFSYKNFEKKTYIYPITNLENYDLNHPVIKLATNPTILSSIANYMGEAPILWNTKIVFSPYKPTNKKDNLLTRIRNLRYKGGFSKYKGSQLFHIDADHPHTVKLWLYLSDVNQDSGPLTFIPGNYSDQAIHDLGKNSTNKQLDKDLKNYINKKRTLTRKAESVFLIDTGRCLHYGSRDVKSKEGRLALIIQYTSIFSEYLFYKKNTKAAKSRINKFLKNGSNPTIDKLLRYKDYIL